MSKDLMQCNDSDKAFERAIQEGRLSRDEKENNFTGNYMYMGTYGDKDSFKHIVTRKYIE